MKDEKIGTLENLLSALKSVREKILEESDEDNADEILEKSKIATGILKEKNVDPEELGMLRMANALLTESRGAMMVLRHLAKHHRLLSSSRTYSVLVGEMKGALLFIAHMQTKYVVELGATAEAIDSIEALYQQSIDLLNQLTAEKDAEAEKAAFVKKVTVGV